MDKSQATMRIACLFLILFVSCQEDPNLKNVCVDPIGTAEISLPAATINNTGNYTLSNVFCFSKDSKDRNACFVVMSSTTSTILWAINFTSVIPSSLIGKIVDAGQFRCLGDVNVKPTAGYIYQVEARLHHGYVVQIPDGTYGRIFVDSWVLDSSGRVTKINLTWQYSF